MTTSNPPPAQPTPPPPPWAGLPPGTVTTDEKGARFIVPPPASTNPEMVNIIIDGKQVAVKKGLNVIEAARVAGTEVPHYCYHPHLSIAGNCRMCQVKVQGMPKMEVGCNLVVRDGMVIETHETSKEVAATQAATLEFILINHPLDCTVCDQAGHCKLQDYHYQYNAKSSRFVEEKEHKVKAVPLGPQVMLDGERCIMCTRCIRFCDEITKTSELGMLNRGDRSVIAVAPGRELNNPLSGSVVDLCPVGALTHRQWRFNTRIWFTEQRKGICPGCSTGCNVSVASRDGEIVQVKARLNSAVNKEWLCDEGRYGFNRFLPKERVKGAQIEDRPVPIADAEKFLKKVQRDNATLVFISPDMLTEEFAIIAKLFSGFREVHFSVAYRERTLTEVEKVLISPNRAANIQGARLLGIVGDQPEQSYEKNLERLRSGTYAQVFVFGDRAILEHDYDAQIAYGLSQATFSCGVLTDRNGEIAGAVELLCGGQSILEKSGVLVNTANRVQYTETLIEPSAGTQHDVEWLSLMAQVFAVNLPTFTTSRELTQWLLLTAGLPPAVAGGDLTIKRLKQEGGVPLQPRT